jgi:hypothetical protein
MLFLSIENIAIAQIVSDPIYPNLTDLQIKLKALANDYSDIVQYKELGYATNGNQPIMALKISDNVNDIEDEPVWVFIGVIHGNEQIGLRILLDLAYELAMQYDSVPNVTEWVNAYEIWLVLSLNPWGYENSFSGTGSVLGTRKNGINTEDPVTSGVDLNRNFDFNWENSPSNDPHSHQYKGESAFSENETQAFRDLILERKPVFGISFHQGLNQDGGEVFYPYGATYRNNTMLSNYATKYANWVYASRRLGPFCKKDDSTGKYILEDPQGSYLCWQPNVNDSQPQGYSNTWNFAAVGTVDFMVEVSRRLFNEEFMHYPQDSLTEDQQTIKAIAIEFARNHREGIKSWFQHFLYSADTVRFMGPGVTGHVIDGQTNSPLSAVIEVEGTTSGMLVDRTSEVKFGRFWYFLLPGEHLVRISAPGYKTWQDTLTIQKNAPLVDLDVALTPGSVNSDTEITDFPDEYQLSPVYPNPSHSQAQFTLMVKRNQTVEISVYNLQGMKVITVYNEILRTGMKHDFKFETKDLPNGLYLLQIRGQYFKTTKMLTVIKK